MASSEDISVRASWNMLEERVGHFFSSWQLRWLASQLKLYDHGACMYQHTHTSKSQRIPEHLDPPPPSAGCCFELKYPRPFGHHLGPPPRPKLRDQKRIYGMIFGWYVGYIQMIFGSYWDDIGVFLVLLGWFGMIFGWKNGGDLADYCKYEYIGIQVTIFEKSGRRIC